MTGPSDVEEFFDINTMQRKDPKITQENFVTQTFLLGNNVIGIGVILYYLWRWSDDWNKTFQKESQNTVSM